MKYDIKCGEYRHFKGKSYIVYGTAKLETGEKYVLYRHNYGTREFWIRPLEMFTEIIERDGIAMQRFSLVNEVSADVSFNELSDILKNGSFQIYHSETLEVFRIDSVDQISGEIRLVPCPDESRPTD